MKPLETAPSLTDRVYAAIVDDILDGALAPGEHRLCAQATDGFGTVTSLVDEVTVTVSESVFRLAPIAG